MAVILSVSSNFSLVVTVSSSLAVVLSSFLNSSGCEFKYSFAFLIADP